jgi:lipopolysaccharide export system protein LptA
MRRLSFSLLAAGLCTLAVSAQQAPIATKGMLNPDAPIDVSADNFIADANAKTGVYTGNVVIHQGEVTMRANAVRTQFVENKPGRILAQGHVVIDAPSGVATGDNGVYEVNPRIITLTGNVVLTKDRNVMRGQKLVVNLVTGQATLDGGEGKKGRVQALFSPTSSDSGEKQKP